ncbi:DNA cytosine methyltransferase, partial [Variovorax sp. HJSM1_2]
DKVPAFLYEPPKRRLHAVGDVLRHMPLPGAETAGPMHRIPALQWKTWVRLAFVEAGSDWRSLNKLAVEDGQLRDYLLVPDFHHGHMGVNRWDEAMGVVAGKSLTNNGKFSVADPRFEQSTKWSDGQALGVRKWGDSTGTVAGQTGPLQGAYSVADIRHQGAPKHSNEFRIVGWDKAAMAVTSAHGSGQSVADPRRDGPSFAKYGVTRYDEPAGTVIAGSTTGQGAFAVADVRPNLQREKGDAYLTGGHYGVLPWAAASGAVSASACHDNGPWSLADPRPAAACTESQTAMPSPSDKLVCRIHALDGTWHRPFTTLELAALQSLIDPEEWFSADGPGGRGETFVLDGNSDQRWREGIGNAVPRKAAKAIGTVMGQTILLARAGETFLLSAQPVWVQPVAVALSVQGEKHAEQ